eukprot:c33441_g1_i1.p1 GENE.c33441_g1_i1~~c33441_g1_i1.p1  ORF type:complete len:305 (-),score=103.46 c33441_g1_i1:141-944(-)
MKLKQTITSMQSQVELEEEFITNRLTKRLELLNHEKEELARQVSREEDHTATLQKKLDQLQLEKVELQAKLEQEEEYIVNKLQKQLREMTQEKEDLRQKLRVQSDALLFALHNGVQRVREVETALDPEDSLFATSEAMQLVQEINDQLNNMRTAQENYKAERDTYKLKAEQFQERLKESDQKNFILEQRVMAEVERRNEIVKTICMAELDSETSLEREVNAVRRSPRSGSPGHKIRQFSETENSLAREVLRTAQRRHSLTQPSVAND